MSKISLGQRAVGVKSINLIMFPSDPSYYPAASRLQRQAMDSGWFKNIYIYGLDERLEHFIPSCIGDGFADEIPRGFGLWSWKPEFIVYCMNNLIKSDEYVVYLDVGCEINTQGASFLNFFLEKAQQDLIVTTSTNKINFLWSSRNQIRRDKPSLKTLFSYQYQAGILVFRNSSYIRSFMRNWMLDCLVNNYEFLRDKSIWEGWLGENRHDQSVFSLLAKERNIVYALRYSLSYNYKVMVTSEFMAAFPFWASRNLSSLPIQEEHPIGVSVSFFAKLKFFVLRIIAKFS
jgi:hypothetical protein